jgi:hypothetical protein
MVKEEENRKEHEPDKYIQDNTSLVDLKVNYIVGLLDLIQD